MALIDSSASDVIPVADQLLIETTFTQDPIDITDSTLASLTIGVTASDTVGASDTIQTGFVRWANLADTLTIPDQVALAAEYNLKLSDTASTTDLSHTWMHADSILSADLEGDSDLNAVLMKRNLSAPVPQTPPPRTVNLPKPPPGRTSHVVVDPNPPRRGET